MPPVKPTSTADITGKTARRQAQAAPRDVGDNVVPKPTPTQEENDLAAAGVHIETHEWDGTPLQNKPPFTPPDPDRPDIPPGATAPTVSSLSPDTAVAGDADDITMTVNGSGFMPGTVIVFNGLDEPTTYVSASAVSTGVKPSLFVVPAECPVGVRNGSIKSNEMPFTFTDGSQRSRR
jgi:hypothetical protein